jgi:phospholipid transport system substrate-binding protein
MTGLEKRFFGAVILLIALGSGVVLARTPTEQIKETIEQVLATVNGSAKVSEQERQIILRNALMPRFDWAEMARQALGKHWNAEPGRQREFVSVFAEFLGNSYIGKIGAYKDEKILFVREAVEKNLAQVDTKIVPSKGDSMSVNYRLHFVRGEWKVYDVVIEDISLVQNYRSQFNRILAKGSFDDLLNRLRAKNSDN